MCDRICSEQINVTAAQGYTLMVFPETESISMNDLSQKMNLAGSTMTRMVDQLVQRGLVVRHVDKDDRRIVRVQLTEPGQTARSTLQASLSAFFNQVLSFIPDDEQSALIQHLDTLNQAIIQTLKTCCPPG